jgi:hypothetical protein
VSDRGSRGDQGLHPQAPQVIAHLAHRVRDAEQGGHLGAQAPVGEAGNDMQPRAQGADQRHPRSPVSFTTVSIRNARAHLR